MMKGGLRAGRGPTGTGGTGTGPCGRRLSLAGLAPADPHLWSEPHRALAVRGERGPSEGSVQQPKPDKSGLFLRPQRPVAIGEKQILASGWAGKVRSRQAGDEGPPAILCRCWVLVVDPRSLTCSSETHKIC